VAILKFKNAINLVSRWKAKIRPANVPRLQAGGIETHYYKNKLDKGMKGFFRFWLLMVGDGGKEIPKELSYRCGILGQYQLFQIPLFRSEFVYRDFSEKLS
jgi:hypothetical protein